jgi:hypothetical protein
MKKITKNILIISGIIFLNSCVTTDVVKQIEINKAKNTAESMIGWIMEDVTNGDVNQENAEMYIENLEELIETIKIIENEGL